MIGCQFPLKDCGKCGAQVEFRTFHENRVIVVCRRHYDELNS